MLLPLHKSGKSKSSLAEIPGEDKQRWTLCSPFPPMLQLLFISCHGKDRKMDKNCLRKLSLQIPHGITWALVKPTALRNEVTFPLS